MHMITNTASAEHQGRQHGSVSVLCCRKQSMCAYPRVAGLRQSGWM
jgi:hypothetical protein